MFRNVLAAICLIIPIVVALAIVGTAGSVQAANKDRIYLYRRYVVREVSRRICKDHVDWREYL